eukprot:3762195-Prymnesium_polylepis.1
MLSGLGVQLAELEKLLSISAEGEVDGSTREGRQVKKLLTRLSNELQASSWVALDLEPEDALRDFLVDLLLVDVNFPEHLRIILTWAGRYFASDVTATAIIANIKALVCMPLPRRNDGTLLHVAAADGSEIAVMHTMQLLHQLHPSSDSLKRFFEPDLAFKTPLYHAAVH